MANPGTPFDGGAVQTVDGQFLTHLFQHAQLHIRQLTIGSHHIAGKGIGGFVQPFGQGITDQAEEGVKAVFHLEQIKHGLADRADAVGIIARKDRHMIDHALDCDQFRGAHLFIGGRDGDHDGNQSILGGHGGRGIGHDAFSFWIAPNLRIGPRRHKGLCGFCAELSCDIRAMAQHVFSGRQPSKDECLRQCLCRQEQRPRNLVKNALPLVFHGPLARFSAGAKSSEDLRPPVAEIVGDRPMSTKTPRLTASLGPEGEGGHGQLRARAAHWARQWACDLDGAEIVTEAALLWPCLRAGQPVMLKVLADSGDERGQAGFLAAWGGRGAVAVLDSGPDALLMERIVPFGPSLEAMALGGADDAAMQVLCDVAARLRGVNAPGLIPLDRRMADLDKLTDWPLARWACGLRDEMLARNDDWVGLHGDLHHFNVMRDARRGWLAIDPKGLLGPPVYDLANCLLNPYPHLDHIRDPGRMARRAAIVAEHLERSPREVLIWTCLHGCLAASWDGAEGYWSAGARAAGQLAGLRPPE